MARYTATGPRHRPPSRWPAWVLSRPFNGYIPHDAAEAHRRSVAAAEWRERRAAWRTAYTDLGAREFNDLARIEAERRATRDSTKNQRGRTTT